MIKNSQLLFLCPNEGRVYEFLQEPGFSRGNYDLRGLKVGGLMKLPARKSYITHITEKNKTIIERAGKIPVKVNQLAFFSSAVGVLQTLVIALGAGLGIWGVINLMEGYGNDNPGAKSQGMKQLMAGGGVALIGITLVPLLSGLFG